MFIDIPKQKNTLKSSLPFKKNTKKFQELFYEKITPEILGLRMQNFQSIIFIYKLEQNGYYQICISVPLIISILFRIYLPWWPANVVFLTFQLVFWQIFEFLTSLNALTSTLQKFYCSTVLLFKKTLCIETVVHLVLWKRKSQELHYKTGVLKNFGKFSGKHLCWNFSKIKF